LAGRRCIDRCSPALLAAALALASAIGLGYEDGAPPAHTGGFGEPDCSACHSDSEKNAPGGSLQVEGLPTAYAAGEQYRLSILLQHPDLASGGFQLALRTAGGEPAGELLSPSDRTQVVTEAGQPYLQHTREGLRTDSDGSIRWELQWRTPESAEPVVLNIAANAANDDISALGDFIYTLERKLLPETSGNGTSLSSCPTVADDGPCDRLLQVDSDDEPGAVGARTAGEAHERESASPAMRAPTVEECPQQPNCGRSL
jgi:hypothetical protein